MVQVQQHDSSLTAARVQVQVQLSMSTICTHNFTLVSILNFQSAPSSSTSTNPHWTNTSVGNYARV